MAHTMLKTTLTTYGLAKRETTSFHSLISDAAALNLRHVLVLDLRYQEDAHSQAHAGRRSDAAFLLRRQRSARYAIFLDRIREVVRLDKRGIEDDIPAIDSLYFIGFSEDDPQRMELCQALHGLCPRVLQLDIGRDQTLDLGVFENLGTLENLIILNAASGRMSPQSSSVLGSVRMLILDCCFRIRDFPHFPGPVALRELEILWNDAMDTLCNLRSREHMLDRLESLKLTSRIARDLHVNQNGTFLKALQTIDSLRTLELVLAHSHIDEAHIDSKHRILEYLPRHLPPNLERFTFRNGPTSIPYADRWIHCIQDHDWLPQLREFGFFFLADPDRDYEQQGTANEDCLRDGEILEGGEKTARMVREAMAESRRDVRIKP
ncbi:hypothetical protein CALVIDRAFT_217393 [Calocera viscosa TUFC12733]|uniref:Uncharacterized protein n=1 Tax=Calocera viscosa (strain TUFC12733) TaxID=1330018 RepID=A0A167RHL9_CALVF|nr:hypothetical protein CALVIDRAFT_217393 [Calocera viscosa TUFC12733]